MNGITFFIIIAAGALVAAAIGITLENNAFNNGICPKCGHEFRNFGIDSYGGRGYKCDDCQHTVWVSYNTVDRNWREQHERKTE